MDQPEPAHYASGRCIRVMSGPADERRRNSSQAHDDLIAGADIEILDRGSGAPILFLQSSQGITAAEPFLGLLARNRRVIAPSHPGFGRSSLPDWLDSVDDIAHIYLELMDRMDLDNARSGRLLGRRLDRGRLATKAPERLQHLVLVGPVGVKTGPVDKLDVPDIFAMPQDKLDALLSTTRRERAGPQDAARAGTAGVCRATARRSR